MTKPEYFYLPCGKFAKTDFSVKKEEKTESLTSIYVPRSTGSSSNPMSLCSLLEKSLDMGIEILDRIDKELNEGILYLSFALANQ